MNHLFKVFFIFFCYIISSSAGVVYPEQNKDQDNQLYLEADEIIYHQNDQNITAKGHIHIRQFVPEQKGWRHIYANELTYYYLPSETSEDQKLSGKIVAKERVILHEPDGSIWQTDFLELNHKTYEGLTKKLLLLTQDKSRLTALKSERTNSELTEFQEVEYSPCKVCVSDHCKPDEPINPLWQIKADQVIHDQKQQKIIYRHARLEVKGIPVFYLPYFSHPDPKVKRKSGLLFPVYGVSKDLGMMLSQPVYYTIAPNRDLTLTPIITTKQGGIIAGEYRHRFYDGEAKIAGSYTRTHHLSQSSTPPTLNGPRPPKPDRWHFVGQTRYDMDEKQRLNININRASDTTYLSRYPINRQTPNFVQQKNLTSSVTFERFETDSYLGIRNFDFQTDTPKTTPFVLPLANFHHQLKPDQWGGTTAVEGNFLSLSRQMPVIGQQATQMQRLSGGVNWQLPYVSPQGHLITTKLSTRADGYYTRRYQTYLNPSPDTSVEKAAARLFPQGSVDWRYPLITSQGQTSWLFQPMATLVASPVNSSVKKIPNEDSTIFELDDINLFQANRFNGIDRTDSGYRVVYGFDNDFTLPQQRNIGIFFGQSRRLDRRQVVSKDQGEDQKSSDYIGRLRIRPISWLVARYRVAIKPKAHHPRYSELGISIGEKALKLDLGHVYLNKTATIKNQSLSQVNWQLSSQVIDNWSLSFAQIKNLNKVSGGNSLASFMLASYKDECFQFDAGIYKTAYRDRDIRPDSGFLLQLAFKNLGSFTPVAAPKYPGSMLTAF